MKTTPSSPDERTLIRRAGAAAGGTALSRVLGYVRDMIMAHFFGAGMFADAFYAAYRIPNLLRRVFGEGALSSSFIPVFSEYAQQGDRAQTQRFISAVFSSLTTVLAVLTVAGIALAPALVHLIAGGFSDEPGKLALTIELTRLMFPFVLFICLAAFLLALLNALNRFFVPAIAPAALSMAEIGYLLMIGQYTSPDNQIRGLAISVIVGGIAQLCIQLPSLLRMGWRINFSIAFTHPGVRKIGLLMLPAIAGMSADQINAFVDTICASFLAQGSVTALYYSNRLMQLPLALFGLAVVSAALPTMSRNAAARDLPALRETLNYSLRSILFILIPSAAALMTLGLPLIQALFQRGHFDAAASLQTHHALFYYAMGLPAYAAVKVIASAFYALKDTRTPVLVALIAMIVNAALNLILMGPLGVGGLALATAIASTLNAVLLMRILRGRSGPLGIGRIALTAGRAVLAASIMAASAMALMMILRGLPLFASCAITLVTAPAVYAACACLLRMEERHPVFALLGLPRFTR